MSDGRVLFAGGTGSSGVVNTVDILGTNGSFTAGPPMLQARSNAACALLQDGRIFVSGGNNGMNPLATAEYFTPSTGAWTSAGSMHVGRYGHTATVTQMGAVLLAGGQTSSGVSSQLEVFRPANNQFTVLAQLSSARTSYAITAIDRHHTLIAGGTDGQNTLSTIDIFDSQTNAVAASGTMLTPRRNFGAVPLLDGTIMFTGGYDQNGKVLASTEIYNAATQTSIAGPTLNVARANHQTYALPGNGSVIVLGGTDGQNALSATEIYQPWTGKFTATTPMNSARTGAGSALMQFGNLVTAGGQNTSGFLAGAETYAFATIATDKPDYSPGSVAKFSGTGWRPGETVTLAVTSFPATSPTTEFTGTAVADSTGRIQISSFNVDKSHLGMEFLLHATGSQSQAEVTFTDADSTAVSLNAAYSPNPNPPSPLLYGQNVTIDYIVTDTTNTSSTPTGTVWIYDNNVSLGVGNTHQPNSVPAIAPNVSNLPAPSGAFTVYTYDPSNILSPGFNEFQLEYKSNGSWSNSLSTNIEIQVIAPNTTTTMNPTSPQVISYGATTVLSALVTTLGNVSPNLPAYSAPPTGTLVFQDGSVPPDSCTGIQSNGPGSGQSTFTCTTPASLPVGAHLFNASYTGLTNVWQDSQSTNGVQITVQAVNTTTTITPNIQSPQIYPATMTLTATVAPVAGTSFPQGTVNFYDGTNNLCGGPVTLNATSTATSCQFILNAGDHSLTATYLPSVTTNWNTSNSSSTPYHINPAPTTTTLAAQSGTINVGQSVTLTATVTCSGTVPCSPIATPPALPPAGTINFMDGVNGAAPVSIASIALTANGTTGSSSASYTTTALVGGQHVITAQYVPPTTAPIDWATNQAATYTQTYTITGLEPTFSMTTAPAAPSAYQSLTFTATAIPAGGHTPTGNVSLVLTPTAPPAAPPAYTSGQVALNNGSATFNVPSGLAAGTYSFAINYSPLSTEVNFVGPVASSVTPATFGVGKTPTTVTVTSSQPSPIVYGTPVTFTATVTPTGVSGTPGGTVQFYENGISNPIGSPITAANGVATLALPTGIPFTTLPSGPGGIQYAITAIFTDTDGNYSSSPTSSAFNLTINQATTTTSISANPTTINLGGQITYSVSVQGSPAGAGNPAGTIALTDTTPVIPPVSPAPPVTGCTITLTNTNPATGSCTVTYNGTAPMTGGTHSISAAFTSTSASMSGSTSTPQTVTVNQSTTTIGAPTVLISGTPAPTPVSVAFNDSGIQPTLSFTFAFGNNPPNPAPSQPFQIYDGTNLIGTLAVPGSSPATTFQVPYSVLQTVGAHTFFVKYAGDANYAAASSTGTTFTVTKFTPTVTPAFQVGNNTYGTAVTLGGTVSNPGPNGSPASPSGTLTFTFGATTLGTCTLSGGTCTLGTTNSALTVGAPDTINIAYNGDANYANATGTGSLTVVKNTVTETIATSPANPTQPAFGSAVNITATFIAAGTGSAGTPTGTAIIYDQAPNTTPPPAAIGTVTLANGIGTLTTSSLVPGTHTFYATYSGDSNFGAVTAYTSSPAISLTISNGNTSVTLTPSANPTALNQTITYNIAVTGGPSQPVGSVTLTDAIAGGGTITTCAALTPLTPGSGNTSTTSCQVNYNSSSVIQGAGSHPITATYTPTGPNASNWTTAMSPVVTEVVGQIAPTISIPTAVPTPGTYGVSLNYSVTLTPANPSPAYGANTVQFYDNGIPLGGPVSVSNIPGTFTSVATVPIGGSHTITAQFIGDSNYAASLLSPKLVFTIGLGTPTVTITAPSSLASPYYGVIGTVANPITVTVAKSTGSSGVTPTGSVSLMAGTTVLATATISSSGVYSFTNNIQLPASLIVNGSPYSFYASYGGDGNWAAAQSTQGSLTINPAAAPVVVTSSIASPAFGQAVTLTATFSGPGNPVAGTLTFLNGTTVITNCVAVTVSNNVATCTTSILPVGADTITVSNLMNDSNHTLGAITTTTVNVGSNTTVTSLSSTPNPSVPGQAVNFTATITVPAPGNGTNTLNGTVSFTYGSTLPLSTCTNMALSTHSSGVQVTCAVPANTAPFNAAGPYLVTAAYTPGPIDPNTASSTTITQTVGAPAPTFKTITSSANPSVYGQTVTITATFTVPGSTSATGMVQFYDGFPNFLGGTQNISGTGSGPYTAQITVPSGSLPVLATGNHNISANYVPGVSDNYGSQNSATQQPPVILVQVVSQASSNSTASVNPTSETFNTAGIANAPVYGEQITFLATILPVAPATGAPTGFAYFTDAGTQIGPNIAVVPGTNSSTVSITTSTLNVPNLGVGTHANIVVHYLGDANFQASNSTAFPLVTISPAPTITALTPIPAAAQKYGTEFVLSAKVCAANVNSTQAQLATCETTPYPGFRGLMMFYDGNTLLNQGGVGAAVDPNAGTASITITLASPPLQASAVGTHNITAAYIATTSATPATVIDPDFAGSLSVAQTLQVAQGPTTTTITSNVNPSYYGQPVTFTAQVQAPGSFGPIPTGTVTFVDNGLVLGAVPLAAVSGIATAQFTVPNALNIALAVGTNNVSVQYSGDTNYAASTTAPLPCTAGTTQGCSLAQVVNMAATTTTIASSSNGSTTGQQVTLTATVSVVAPGAPVLSGPSAGPTGTVTFTNNANGSTSNVLGTGILTRVTVSGSTLYQATLTLTLTLTNSGNTTTQIIATYSGDADYVGSASAPLNQSVQRVNSQVVLTSSLNPSILGQPVTYTVTITPTPPGTGVPTGAVTLFDGSNVLANLTLVGGQTSYTSALPVGGHLLSAAYPGDVNFQPSTSTSLNETVNKIQSTLNLTSSVPAGAVASQVITFTAQIQPTPPVGVAYPTGQIGFFMDGATQIGAASLASGVAALSTTLPAGNHQIQAFYIGDNNWTGAQSIYLSQVVGTATTTTQIVSSDNPSVFGQPVVLTITVAVPYPGTVPATGTVQLYDSGNAIGTPLSANNGTFSTTLTSLGVGTHSIVAAFQTNGSFSQSTSAALSQIVNKAPTVTTLAVLPNSSTSNESVTLTAVVTVPSPGSTATTAPTGTVQFVNTTTNAILGTSQLTQVGGVWTATLNTAALTSGSQSQLLTATYSGDGNFATSTSLPQAQSVFGTQITVVNAAGYTGTNFAPNSFATIFGSNLAYTTTTATVTPWPSSLAGTTVTVTDSAGVARLAPLYYVSLPQINFIIPANTANGLATVTVTNASGESLSTWILVTVTSPGLYSENSSGAGVAAGYLLTVHADGTQSAQAPLFQYNPNTSQFVSIPIVWNVSTDQQYLVLYGTGIRNAAQSAVTAMINGISIPVIYAGAQPQFLGEDQVNLGPIPASLKGSGSVNITITVNGQESNTVTVYIQ